MNANLRRVVIIVAALNLVYFGVEFVVALAIGSVSLFADSVDFLEDASVNFLIAIALGWSATSRARVSMALTGILLIPGLATLWMAWEKFLVPLPPAPLPLSLAGAGALAINMSCAFMLLRFRTALPRLIEDRSFNVSDSHLLIEISHIRVPASYDISNRGYQDNYSKDQLCIHSITQLISRPLS